MVNVDVQLPVALLRDVLADEPAVKEVEVEERLVNGVCRLALLIDVLDVEMVIVLEQQVGTLDVEALLGL